MNASIYSAPAEKTEPEYPLSVKQRDRAVWSIGGATLSVLCVLLASWWLSSDIWLESLIESAPSAIKPDDSILLYELLIPLLFAVLAMSVAVACSGALLLRGQTTPLIWLIPMGLFLMWFAATYDWEGVIATGKGRVYKWQPITVGLAIGRFRLVLGSYMALVLLPCIYETRVQKRRDASFSKFLNTLKDSTNTSVSTAGESARRCKLKPKFERV